MVADVLNWKSRGALASIASREWRMLETMGQGVANARGYVGEFRNYTISIEQSGRVLGAGCRDSVHQGLGTVRYGLRGLAHPRRW